MRKRRIAIVTSSRADFGHQVPVFQELHRRKNIQSLVWVTGSHLVSGKSKTLDEIRKAKIRISSRVSIFEGRSDPTQAIARGIIQFEKLIRKQKPDIVVVFGDRFEMLAPALAAVFNRVPLAHIHGGETSAGSLDELIRHSLTKLSSLHFAAAKDYHRRLLQLGENPKHTFFTGGPGVETIQKLKRLSKTELADILDIPVEKPWISLVYHPATRGAAKTELPSLLKELKKLKNHFFLVSAANLDPAGKDVNKSLQAWSRKASQNSKFFWNMGHVNYINALRHSEFLVGNSSSGIIEAPLLGVPSINIGDRQAGRLRAASVIEGGFTETSIRKSIRRALSSTHKRKAKKKKSPYLKRGASKKIVDVLSKMPLASLDQKPFFDLKGKRK